jgi:hypothetical protein
MEASAVNAPHPDQPDEAETFFGGETEGGAGAEMTVAEMEADAKEYEERTGMPGPTPSQTAERTAELRGSSEVAAMEPGPEPEPGDAPQTGALDQPDAPDPAEKSGGQLSREYIVFQKVALTEKTLRHLLLQIETGSAMPRVAYFELARATTRNDKQAIGEAYAANQEQLGERCDLAAVSSRAFKERRVQPEEVPAERRVKIT